MIDYNALAITGLYVGAVYLSSVVYFRLRDEKEIDEMRKRT